MKNLKFSVAFNIVMIGIGTAALLHSSRSLALPPQCVVRLEELTVAPVKSLSLTPAKHHLPVDVVNYLTFDVPVLFGEYFDGVVFKAFRNGIPGNKQVIDENLKAFDPKLMKEHPSYLQVSKVSESIFDDLKTDIKTQLMASVKNNSQGGNKAETALTSQQFAEVHDILERISPAQNEEIIFAITKSVKDYYYVYKDKVNIEALASSPGSLLAPVKGKRLLINGVVGAGAAVGGVAISHLLWNSFLPIDIGFAMPFILPTVQVVKLSAVRWIEKRRQKFIEQKIKVINENNRSLYVKGADQNAGNGTPTARALPDPEEIEKRVGRKADIEALQPTIDFHQPKTVVEYGSELKASVRAANDVLFDLNFTLESSPQRRRLKNALSSLAAQMKIKGSSVLRGNFLDTLNEPIAQYRHFLALALSVPDEVMEVGPSLISKMDQFIDTGNIYVVSLAHHGEKNSNLRLQVAADDLMIQIKDLDVYREQVANSINSIAPAIRINIRGRIKQLDDLNQIFLIMKSPLSSSVPLDQKSLELIETIANTL